MIFLNINFNICRSSLGSVWPVSPWAPLPYCLVNWMPFSLLGILAEVVGRALGGLRGHCGESLCRAELAGHCFSGHPWAAGNLFSSFVKAPELFFIHEILHRIWHLIEKERNWSCWIGSALLWNADKHYLKILWLHHGMLQRFLPLNMKNAKNAYCFSPMNRNYLSLLLILEIGANKVKGWTLPVKALGADSFETCLWGQGAGACMQHSVEKGSSQIWRPSSKYETSEFVGFLPSSFMNSRWGVRGAFPSASVVVMQL